MYKKSIDEVFKSLKTSKDGLINSEVEKRRKEYGINIIPRKKKDGILKIFFSEFKDPIVILLLFAVLASFVVGEVIDAIAIILIVLIFI